MSRVKPMTSGWIALTLSLGVAMEANAAQASAIELSLVGPADCPSASAVQGQVQRLARLAADDPHRLAARLVIDSSKEPQVRLVLTASLDDGVPGERTFVGASCAEVTDAAALTLALMLNPDASPPEQETERPSQPRLPSPVPAPAPAPTPPTARPRSPVHAFAGLTGGARAGVLPAIAPEAGGTVGISLDRFSTWLGVGASPAQTAHAPGTVFGGRFWALSGTWLACWFPLGEAELQLGPCAGIGFTRLSGDGVGITRPNDTQVSWLSGTLGLSASLALGPRISARGLLLGAVPATRPTLYLQDIGGVHQPARASLALQAIVTIRLF